MPSGQRRPDYVERVLRWFRQRKLFAALIVLAMTLGGIAPFTGILKDLMPLFCAGNLAEETANRRIPVTSLALEEVLKSERGNLEKCLRGVEADMFSLKFEITPSGSVSNIYVFALTRISERIPAPQERLMKTLEETLDEEATRGDFRQTQLVGEANSCVLQVLLRDREYRADPSEAVVFFRKYFAIGSS